MFFIVLSVVVFPFLAVKVYKEGSVLDHTHYTIAAFAGGFIAPFLFYNFSPEQHFILAHGSVMAGCLSGCVAYDAWRETF